MSLSLKFALCVQFFSQEPEWLGICILQPEPKLSNSPGTKLKEECQLLEDMRSHDQVWQRNNKKKKGNRKPNNNRDKDIRNKTKKL